jgi:bifunctional ADP-heptose synthase (sugar kinase/adenylyltransferase)
VNKGPGRPYFNHDIRKKMLESLSIVDEVIISDEPFAVGIINKVKPNYYIKGPDYKKKEDDITGGIYDEESAVKSHGGKVVFTDDETYSSSTLINKFFQTYTPEQESIIQTIKDIGGLDLINETLDKISTLKVCVVGEAIYDKYIFCTPEHLSSKYACISANYIKQECYKGGAWAIKNHIESFVELVNFVDGDMEPPSKIRYIDDDSGKRLFELVNMHPNTYINWKEVGRILQEVNSFSDITLLCDFGHGFFNKAIMGYCEDLKRPIALNVQTNSSNYGFNLFTKHKKYDYLSIDYKEAKLAMHDRTSDREDIFDKVYQHCRGDTLSMTLGRDGSYYKCDPGRNRYDHYDLVKYTQHSPAFADEVVDTVGAGDAYFAITSLLYAVEANDLLVPFIGNIFAGLKTKIIGNKKSVTKADLVKAVTGILK